MKIGLIDVDNWAKVIVGGVELSKVFPNLPLMKISAWYKQNGDDVSWYDGSHYDIVYVSKVFNFNKDFNDFIDADNIIYGGSGYAIKLENGKEVYHKELDPHLPDDIEHIYPDYDLYGITDTSYGFLQRGCPRACSFCHVKSMQGTTPHVVAPLSEFWRGQKNIVLLDPNISACKEWKSMFQQLIDSRALVDFSQGLDIRCMNREKSEMLKQIRIKTVHFAWDRYEDGKFIKPKLKDLVDITGWDRHKIMVYVLTNFDTTIYQDIERVMYIRSLGIQPYVTRYDKTSIKRGSLLNSLARWVNFIPVFWKYETFEDYLLNEVSLKNKEAYNYLKEMGKI